MADTRLIAMCTVYLDGNADKLTYFTQLLRSIEQQTVKPERIYLAISGQCPIDFNELKCNYIVVTPPDCERWAQFIGYKRLVGRICEDFSAAERENIRILFSDGDDLWHPHRVKRIKERYINFPYVESVVESYCENILVKDSLQIKTIDNVQRIKRKCIIHIDSTEPEYVWLSPKLDDVIAFFGAATEEVLQCLLCDRIFVFWLDEKWNFATITKDAFMELSNWTYFYRQHDAQVTRNSVKKTDYIEDKIRHVTDGIVIQGSRKDGSYSVRKTISAIVRNENVNASLRDINVFFRLAVERVEFWKRCNIVDIITWNATLILEECAQ